MRALSSRFTRRLTVDKSAGTALQVLLLLGGLFHWSLAALAVIFGAAWAYATYVRRSILG